MGELFKNMTWLQFLLATGAATFLYYTAALVYYFRKDLIKAFDREQGVQADAPDEVDEQAEELATREMTALEMMVNEIGHSILVPGNKATTAELLEQLKASVANFGGLGLPGHRHALNNYIIEKAKDNCGIEFTEDQLEQAWQELRQ